MEFAEARAAGAPKTSPEAAAVRTSDVHCRRTIPTIRGAITGGLGRSAADMRHASPSRSGAGGRAREEANA